jgi:ATP-dependent protease ClpP protease subunit
MPWRLTPLAAGEAVELVIHAPIGDMHDGSGVSSRAVIEAINKVPRAKEIRAFINSPGGLAFDGMAIYSALSRHQARVVVEIEGIAASAASIIAMAGDEIRIAESGFVMIHDPWGLALGNAADMTKASEDLERLAVSMRDVYAARTRQAPDVVRAAMAAETWFTGAEAVAWGLAGGVLANKKAAACAVPAQLRAAFSRMPQLVAATPVAAAEPSARPISRATADALIARVARANADLAAARARRSGS